MKQAPGGLRSETCLRHWTGLQRLFTLRGSRVADNSGMALVLTLLIVAVVTAMVVEFAYGVYVQTSELHNWQTAQQLSFAAKSAARLASKLVPDKPEDSYTKGFTELSQKSPITDLGGTITLRIEDENGKFNLNSLGGLMGQASYNSFKRLLAALQLRPEIADRILDWIDTDNIPNNGQFPETERGAKNAKLDSVDELLLIPGIDRETYEKLQPYVTIYTDNRININSAGVPVLMSLSDSITKDAAERIVKERENMPFVKLTDLSRAIGNTSMDAAGTTTSGTAYRVVAVAQSGDIKRVVECVIDTNGKVKYWKEI